MCNRRGEASATSVAHRVGGRSVWADSQGGQWNFDDSSTPNHFSKKFRFNSSHLAKVLGEKKRVNQQRDARRLGISLAYRAFQSSQQLICPALFYPVESITRRGSEVGESCGGQPLLLLRLLLGYDRGRRGLWSLGVCRRGTGINTLPFADLLAHNNIFRAIP